ncbi:Trp biosynthesis-associated membrane protein [Solwaraspora sp. WMMB335]|uniref:Trp biosynthesis-associated membrane protein n=1 Tax=Solwaraspora sp. WMMB335 TaxID=3404118 RepID=UPI003B92C896
MGAARVGRRGLVVSVAVCLAGSGLALYAAGRGWAVVNTERPTPLPDVVTVRTGAQLLPWLPAVALVGLAGAGAVLATRGWPRRLVGVLLAGAGAVLAAGSSAFIAGMVAVDDSAAGTVRTVVSWPVAAAGGAVLLVAGGLSTILRSGPWPAMGARYERSAGRRRPDRPAGPAGSTSHTRAGSTLDAWNALDRGEDPTD